MNKETKQRLIDEAKARSPDFGTEDPNYRRPSYTEIWNRAVIACLNAVDEHWEERFGEGSEKPFLDGILSTRRIIDGVAKAGPNGKAALEPQPEDS